MRGLWREKAVSYSLARGKAAVTQESGEVARSGVLSGASSLVSCTWPWAAPGRQRENTETVAKQKQLPSMGRVRAPRRSRESIIYFTAPSA